jgi:hypothetical protein
MLLPEFLILGLILAVLFAILDYKRYQRMLRENDLKVD